MLYFYVIDKVWVKRYLTSVALVSIQPLCMKTFWTLG